jgi:ABC-type nitrate/sulfonate/bicarbonate transport system substrate-binding protein
LIALALAALAPAGFAAGNGEEERGQAGSEPALEEVTLMLDWVANVNHVGVFVARDRGFFAKHGLDVRIVEPGEVYATTAVVSGQAEFGIDFQESVTLLRADEVPIVSIAAILQTNTSGFAVRSGEGIKSPADFAGLTYGTFNSPFEEPTLSGLVRCAGGDPDGIKYVTAGTDLLAMLQQKRTDLVWIYYGTQGFQAQRIGLEIDYFPLNDYQECIPDYYTPVIIASEKLLVERPALAKKFLAALTEAHEYVVANPREAAQGLSEAVPELNASELSQSVPWLAEHMIMDAPSWGHQELSVWSGYAEWMREVGVLSGLFDPAGAFTTEFLP